MDKIKEALPDLIQIVMFYDEGTVFQTTYEQPINIPKLGENLTESLSHIRQLLEICNIEIEPYTKLIYETKNIVIIVIKLGERSNLALFFRKGDGLPKISSIRRYLLRIENLMDTDKLELDKRSLEDLKKEVTELELEVQSKLSNIEKKKSEITNIDSKINALKDEIEAKKKEINYEDDIREKIEHIVESKKEDLQECEEKETKKILKTEIKEEKVGLTVLEKSLDEGLKVIDKFKANIKSLDDEKGKILTEINIILDEIKKIKEKITEKLTEISKLEEAISVKEKEKFEQKMLEESLFK